MFKNMLKVGGAALVTWCVIAVPALGQANLNPQSSLCLELREALPSNSQGFCSSDDAECNIGGIADPDGVLSCSDDDLDPLNGGICVDQACYLPANTIVVDIEVGPTMEPVCGAQVFLGWDAESLSFLEATPDPDGDFAQNNPGLTFLLAYELDIEGGTLDLAVALPPEVTCNEVNGTTTGGTFARLYFEAQGDCKGGGVAFRQNDPPSFASGPNGAMSMVGCNGEAEPSSTDDYVIQGQPQWICPASVTAHAECGEDALVVHFDEPTVDSCDSVPLSISEACTVEYYPACESSLDCPVGGCVDGLCDAPFDPPDYDLDQLLISGGVFLEGQTVFACGLTNSCGLTGSCGWIIESLGPLPDVDEDGLDDPCDNCPLVFNPGQGDFDGNGIGNACDIISGIGAQLPTISAGGLALLIGLLMLGVVAMARRQRAA